MEGLMTAALDLLTCAVTQENEGIDAVDEYPNKKKRRKQPPVVPFPPSPVKPPRIFGSKEEFTPRRYDAMSKTKPKSENDGCFGLFVLFLVYLYFNKQGETPPPPPPPLAVVKQEKPPSPPTPPPPPPKPKPKPKSVPNYLRMRPEL